MSEDRFLILRFLPDADAPVHWLRVADGAIVEQGDDLVAIRPADDKQLAEERVIAIAPAADVTVNWAELPGLADAQARAAARLLASENSISPLDSLHVAVGEEREGGDRLVVTVDHARIAHWLGAAQASGFDPDALVPASLLLSRPENGFVKADILGETIVAGPGSVFADDEALTSLIVGDAPIETLSNGAARSEWIAALSALPINLRQANYARRRRWALDWGLIRRLAAIGIGIVGVLLAINVALILKYHYAADALELRTTNLARTVVPDATSDEGAIQALDDRLAGYRGGGAGFSATTAAIFSAVRAVPNVELTSFDFGIDGTLRIGIAAATPGDIPAFQAQLERYGFDGTASAPQQAAGRQIVEMTVKLP
ncbi:type II secretion system protein GspL [Sphingomonas cavernae]|nr:type II secretion system protein GspL [Sphingomonas cavernae]